MGSFFSETAVCKNLNVLEGTNCWLRLCKELMYFINQAKDFLIKSQIPFLVRVKAVLHFQSKIRYLSGWLVGCFNPEGLRDRDDYAK
jgi:hypothetical protein